MGFLDELNDSLTQLNQQRMVMKQAAMQQAMFQEGLRKQQEVERRQGILDIAKQQEEEEKMKIQKVDALGKLAEYNPEAATQMSKEWGMGGIEFKPKPQKGSTRKTVVVGEKIYEVITPESEGEPLQLKEIGSKEEPERRAREAANAREKMASDIQSEVIGIERKHQYLSDEPEEKQIEQITKKKREYAAALKARGATDTGYGEVLDSEIIPLFRKISERTSFFGAGQKNADLANQLREQYFGIKYPEPVKESVATPTAPTTTKPQVGGKMLTLKDLSDYATKHGISVEYAKKYLGDKGYTWQE